MVISWYKLLAGTNAPFDFLTGKEWGGVINITVPHRSQASLGDFETKWRGKWRSFAILSNHASLSIHARTNDQPGINMVAFSKALHPFTTKLSCHELAHTWTSSCTLASAGIFRSCFVESFKIYGLLYLVSDRYTNIT